MFEIWNLVSLPMVVYHVVINAYQIRNQSMQTCRGDNFSRSDKIVASLAHEYFVKAENKGNSKYFKQKNWLEENEVLFSYADWFMTDKDIQASGKVFPSGKCYDWVSESLAKQSDW